MGLGFRLRMWGIWGSYYNIREAIFYLLKGTTVTTYNGAMTLLRNSQTGRTEVPRLKRMVITKPKEKWLPNPSKSSSSILFRLVLGSKAPKWCVCVYIYMYIQGRACTASYAWNPKIQGPSVWPYKLYVNSIGSPSHTPRF